jgi:hypothetical protein
MRLGESQVIRDAARESGDQRGVRGIAASTFMGISALAIWTL